MATPVPAASLTPTAMPEPSAAASQLSTCATESSCFTNHPFVVGGTATIGEASAPSRGQRLADLRGQRGHWAFDPVAYRLALVAMLANPAAVASALMFGLSGSGFILLVLTLGSAH